MYQLGWNIVLLYQLKGKILERWYPLGRRTISDRRICWPAKLVQLLLDNPCLFACIFLYFIMTICTKYIFVQAERVAKFEYIDLLPLDD